MKNIIKSLALAAVVLVSGASFTACKKGENDPALSLSSRKSRLVGEWTLSKGETKSTSGSSTTTTTYTETSATQSSGGASVTFTYTEKMEIVKDGTYTSTVVVTNPGSSAETYTTKGRWSFLGKNKDAEYKNKEVLALMETSSSESGTTTCNCTTTESNPDYADLYEIDQLKSKEMIVKYKNTITGTGGSTTIEGSKTYVIK